jgi:hypothetical protein
MKSLYLVMQLSRAADDNATSTTAKHLFVRQHNGQGNVHTKYNNGWSHAERTSKFYTGFQLEFLS